MATKQFLTDADFEDTGPLKPAKTGVLGRAGDLGLSALKSAIAVPETAVGLANIVSGGKAGKAVEDAGVRFKDAKQILDDQKSVAGQLAQRRFDEAQGFTGKLGAAIENPSLIANTLVESAAPMLAGGLAGRGLSMAAPRLAGYAGAIGEGAIGAGSAAEQIRQESTDGELSGKQAALAGATGLATTAFGALGNKIGNKLGVGDIDNALIGGAASQAPAKQAGLAKRVAGGAFSEGVLEELPQSVSEQMLQNVALDRDPMQGVDSAAAMGLVTGGAMGAGFGILNHAKAPAAAPEQATGGTQPGQTTPTGSAGPTLDAPAAHPALGQSLTGTPMADLIGGSGLTGGANPLQAGLSTLTSDNQMYPGMNTEPTGYTVDPETGAIIQAEPVGARQMTEPEAQVEAPAPATQAPVAPEPAAPALGESLTGTPVADMLDTRTPSQRMGLNPESGGLTTAAAIAVDSGASPVTAGMGLRALSGASPAAQPVAEQSTPQQQAQPPAQQPILNNGKPFTLAEVGQANQAIGGTAVSVPGGWAIQPPATVQQPAATPATAMPTAATPAASAQSAILGRNSQPIAEGGQPFFTREEAKAEKRMQPLMRVAPAEGGGFILKPASERQLAAVEKAAKRLKYPSTGETGPRSLHGFILQIGGLASGTMPDIGFDLNPRVGNRRLFSPRGKTIEQAAMAAKQEGYIQDEDENTLIEALKRSLNVSPVYTPDGYEAMAEAQMQARYEDFLAAEQDGGAENDWSRLTPEELAETGYNDYDEATQAEIRALVAQAEALGVDAESILEDVAQRTENATQKDYENAAKSAIEAAIRSSEESRSRDLGQAGAEAGPATADTQAAPAAVTGPASDVRARNLAALKARMMAGQTKPTPATPPAQTKATPAPEAGPTNQGATNGQGQETLLKAEQPTGAAAMVSGAPVAEQPSDTTKPGGFTEKVRKKAGKVDAAPAQPILTSPTKADIEAQQARAEQAAKAKAAQDKADAARAAKERERKDVAAASVTAADTFELGGDAMSNLTGQQDVFGAMEQAAPQMTAEEAAAYLKDFVYNLDQLDGMTPRAQVSLSSPMGKSGRDTLLMDAFGISREKAHDINNRLDSRQPKKLRNIDMQEAFDVFPGLRKIVDDAIQNGQQKAKPAQPTPPKATELTPKQFHEAKLAFIAADTGASMADVRENYDTEAGRAENDREWAGQVESAAKAGEVLTSKTLDKLYELAPNVRLPETAIPQGYQRPEARRAEAEDKQARVDGRKAAKASAKSERQKASDDLKAALGDLGDIFSKNTRMNITAEQEQKLLPVLSRVMDAAFRLGYLKFKDAAKFALDKISDALGSDVADQITLDHMQGAYIAMAGKYQGQGADTKKAVVNIEDRAEIENHTAQAADTKEEADVPSPNTSVERNSRQPATEPAVGDVVQNGRRPDATGDNQVPGQPSGSDGGRQPDGAGVQADGPVVDGIGGDLSVHSGDAKRDAAVIATGAEFSERGSGVGNDGVSAEPVATGKVAAAAQSSGEKNRLALKQKQADSIGLKYADLDNIKATLPMLLDGQQEDVFKAETRFQKPDGYGMLFTNGTGTGKAQPLDAKLMTPTGWKLMGDIKPGDQVVGVDGKPTNVLAVYPQGEKPIFRVTFSDGATTECCDEHLWETQTLYARRKASANPDWDCAQPKVRQLSEIRSTLNEQHFIPVASPLDLSATNLAIPPYIMGAILGDGCIAQNTIIIASADPEIADRVTQDLPASMSLRLREDGKRCPQYRISLDDQVRRDNGQMEQHPWLRELRALGLHGCDSATKFVPESYLIGSIQQRTELLQGMLDTDGWVDAKSKSPYFTSISRRLVDAVAFLARSLGGTATINTKRPTYHYQGERRNGQIAYNVCLNLPDGIAPFTLSRKADIYRANTKYPPRRRIVGVEMVGTKPAQCIAVDHPRHLYVTDDCIVTHNTFTGLGIIKRMARQGKTNILVVVPDEKIGDDWIGSAKLLGLNVSKLADTKDAGKGIVLTTYANLGSNDALATRAWDLVVSDEAHNLMKSSDGTVTTYLQNLRAITMHPDGAFQRYAMLNREKIDRSKALSEEITGLERMIAADSTTAQQRAAWDAKSESLQKELGALRGELDKALNATRADAKASQGAKRTRLAALSATPFAYEFTIDWANGYLFDYNDGQASDETESRGYNSGSNRERFFMQHFGYSMRYNKLTKPDPTKVDTGLMQRSFNTMLKKAGSLSGRMLDVKADYDRRFVLVDSAIGNQIDEALNWISDMAGDSVPGFSTLRDVIGKKFDYLSRRYLLEAIKAKEAVPIVRKHMEMGRKVVVFHDYKKGGGFNPFNVSMGDAAGLDTATEDTKALAAAIDSFKQKFAALVNTPFQSLLSPIEVFSNEFPGVLLINGDEKKADLLARYKAFQDDATGPQVALVQSAKNAGWSGHDTTGKHQRVLINLGQPTAPTLAIQQEGRIYRTGQVSNAIMRYMNTGTNWEKWAFATTIAGRASAAENLGMGELSRALKDSFIGAFEESDAYPPGHEGEGTGGKERDAAQNNQLTAWDRAKSLYWATQKKNSRTKAQEGVDYFATPEPVGMKMAEWLGSRGGERTLEPSAGHGAIARWLPETTKRTVIEPSNTLRSRLALVMNPSDDRILDVKFEALDVVNKFDGIAMNPPFGVGGKTAIEHLAKAATHLSDGGRIVALIPTGPAADKRFDQWLNEVKKQPLKPLAKHPSLGDIYKGDTINTAYYSNLTLADGRTEVNWVVDGLLDDGKYLSVNSGGIGIYVEIGKEITVIKPTGKRFKELKPAVGLYTVGEVLLPSVTFERAGTAVSTRIVVLEKQSKAENAPNQKATIDLSSLSDINDLFERMENLTMPERKMTEAQKAEVEAGQKQAEASVAKTERNEAAKKQSSAVGDKVTLAGKEYDVVVYTTNAGKEIRGAWVKTKELATRFNDRTFQKKPLGWFVREKDFHRTDANQKASVSRAKEQPLTPASTIRAAITNAYGNLLDKLEGKGLVTIAQTEREAIEAAAQARADKTGGDAEAIAGRMMSMAGLDVKYSANGNIEGFFDKQTGKSFLVADNLTATSAPGTLMHEVGIHMAAGGKMEPLFKRAGSILKTGTQNEFIQRVKARMARAGETSDEEAAAYIVTEYENDRAKAPVTIGKWLADLTAAVRAWLFSNGIILKAEQLTVADIAAVARANARSMARGGPNGGPGGGQAFSRQDQEIRFSRAADMAGNAIDKAKQTADKAMGKDFPRAASMPDLNDDQRSLLGKVGASQSPASDAIKAATDRAGLKIRQGMVDRFAALKELDEKALGQNFIADSITNSAWVLAKMSSAGSGALNAMMKTGRIEMDAQQKVIGLKGAPNGGLTASLQKLGGPAEVERFFAWMAANRAEKLMGEGRENLFTPAEIAAGKTLNTGSTEGGKVRPALYSQVHAEFQQYRDDVLAIAEQTGIINSDNRAMWRDEFYVPFYRVMEDDADRGRSGGNGLSRQEAYKKLKGGKQNLNDLMENTLMNFHHLLSASLKNQAAVQAIKNAEHVGIARKVPEARRDTKTSTFVLVDGKKVFYEVDDPLVFESITTLADPGLNNTAVRVMGAFKRLFTNMTTATPQFIIANTFRDLLQASATSPTSKNIAKNLKEGIQSYRDEKTRAEMLASGGAFSFGHIYGMSADEVKESLQKTVAGAGLISSPSMIPSMMRKMWDAWSNITDLSENASRAATYVQNVEQMGKLRAAFEARDVMDFSQHGAWPAVRLLVRIVPFLNARLQGLDKLYRSGLKPSILTAMGKGTDTDKQAAARFAMVTGALTLATMALYLINADDDEYKKLEEWQKDTYWFIRIGENAFFLPKPFEVGAIATMAERTLQQAMDDKATGKLFRERMWEMLMQTFAFNPTPQMFQPLIDVYSNKDAFTGRDIESAGMERMSTGLRSRDTTTAPATALSAVSRVFGDESSIAVSPVQADHLIKGYLGGVGAMAAGWIDTMYRAATGQSSPDKAWSEYQPIRRFYRDLDVPVANTRYTTLFYDGLKESNRVYADVMELQKLGRTEEAEALAAEKRNPLQMRIALNAQQRRLTEINNRMKEVRRSDKDGEWKRREIDLLNTQKAMITERMGKRIEDARVQ